MSVENHYIGHGRVDREAFVAAFVMTATLQAIMIQNGLYDQPIVLIEAHRILRGKWRIKFTYDDHSPLSMDVQKASRLALSLHEAGESDLAGEVDEAIERAAHYETCS